MPNREAEAPDEEDLEHLRQDLPLDPDWDFPPYLVDQQNDFIGGLDAISNEDKAEAQRGQLLGSLHKKAFWLVGVLFGAMVLIILTFAITFLFKDWHVVWYIFNQPRYLLFMTGCILSLGIPAAWILIYMISSVSTPHHLCKSKTDIGEAVQKALDDHPALKAVNSIKDTTTEIASVVTSVVTTTTEEDGVFKRLWKALFPKK